MQKRTNIAHLIGRLSEHSPAGFAVALHISYATPAYLFQSYPAAWMEEYSARGLHLEDPTVAWGFSNIGAIRWSALVDKDSGGVFARAREFGLEHGVTVAVLLDGSRSVASFARQDREFTDAEIEQISALLTQLHHETAGGEGLTEADRAALRSMSIRLTHA